MFSIPLPFIISFLLAMLIFKLYLGNTPGRFHTLLFLAACALQVTLVGLRWTFDWAILHRAQPVMASLLPPLAWWCFARTRHPQTAPIWPLLIPVGFALLTAMTAIGWPVPLDSVLVILYLVYGLALCRLALAGADNFFAVRLSESISTQKSVLAAGVLLCFFGLSDAFVTLDYSLFNGTHAATIITLCNLFILPLLAIAVTIAQHSVPPPQSVAEGLFTEASVAEKTLAKATFLSPQTDEIQLVERIKALIRDHALFRDPDLTLDRLSRKAVIPARQISQAVNRVLNCNVSQMMNAFRVEEASQLLINTDLPITTIIFESGFRTKSNFNREFLRQTGMSPGDYRRANATGSPASETP